jgi:hypothetical protein
VAALENTVEIGSGSAGGLAAGPVTGDKIAGRYLELCRRVSYRSVPAAATGQAHRFIETSLERA